MLDACPRNRAGLQRYDIRHVFNMTFVTCKEHMFLFTLRTSFDAGEERPMVMGLLRQSHYNAFSGRKERLKRPKDKQSNYKTANFPYLIRWIFRRLLLNKTPPCVCKSQAAGAGHRTKEQ